MTSVRFVTPTRAEVRAEHMIFREWLVSHELRTNRFKLTMGVNEGRPVGSNRCHIAKAALDAGDDWLVMLDSDTVPSCNPLDYIDCGYDVIGFPYLTWRGNDDAPLRWFPREPQSGEDVAPVDMVGGGCIMIARRILEHPDMQAPFMDLFNDNGVCIDGEDVTFCRRAKDAGFSIGCVMDKPLAHFKTVELLTLYQWINREK